MKKIVILTLLAICSNSLIAQCFYESPSGWTLEVDLTIIDVTTSQQGSSCVANVVLEYDIDLQGLPSLWTLQGNLTCDGADGSSFFALPNEGGSGTVTSSNFSYQSTDCNDIDFSCPVTLTINGPGLSTEEKCLPASTLPLDLINFDYNRYADVTVLKWKTLHEVNFDHFELQASQTTAKWTTIEKIAARGSSDTEANYEYQLLDSSSPHKYFRLKMNDTDGSVAYSKILAIHHITLVKDGLVYPNPVSSALHIPTSGDEPAINIHVFDSQLRLVRQVSSGYSVNVSDLNPGLYVVTYSHADVYYHARIQKL